MAPTVGSGLDAGMWSHSALTAQLGAIHVCTIFVSRTAMHVATASFMSASHSFVGLVAGAFFVLDRASLMDPFCDAHMINILCENVCLCAYVHL